MSSRQKIADEVRRLRDLSLEKGAVSPERVTAVLAALAASRKPRELRSLLRAYHVSIRREIAKGEARVEFAGSLTESAKAGIAAELTRTHGRPVSVVAVPNESLIAGVRVRLGDDVYDASIRGHLGKLSAALA